MFQITKSSFGVCLKNEICSILEIPFFLFKSNNIWFDLTSVLRLLLVRALKQHSLSQNFLFSRQIYTSIAYYLLLEALKAESYTKGQ